MRFFVMKGAVEDTFEFESKKESQQCPHSDAGLQTFTSQFFQRTPKVAPACSEF